MGAVISGLVELGVMIIRSAAEAMGDMALPEPLICGPTMATTFGSETNCLVFVAAWAGSYWPADTVPSSLISGSIRIWPAMPPRALMSSTAISAPSRMLAASAASAPVNGRLMPTVIAAGISWAPALGTNVLETSANVATNDETRRPTGLRIGSSLVGPAPRATSGGILGTPLQAVNQMLRTMRGASTTGKQPGDTEFISG